MGGGGTLLGGYLVKRLNLRIRGILKMCFITTTLCLLCMLVFLINCPIMPFAGVNEPYGNDTEQ